MKKMNNMICDIETGVCGEVDDSGFEILDFSTPQKKVDLYYVTDPICSHCWALEPVFRRFIETYGHHVNLHKVMGGLLEKWHDGPIDPANGIFKPADVAGHWRDVGVHSRMPIDGSLMIDNPVQSSYPASRVFLQIQDSFGKELASQFLRRAREALFLFNRNISDEEELKVIVREMGLNEKAILSQSSTEAAHERLQQDFALARRLGARGFPSLIFVNEEQQGVKVTGTRSFDMYEESLERILGFKPTPFKLRPMEELIQKDGLLLSREIEEIYSMDKEEVKDLLVALDATSWEVDEILGERFVTSRQPKKI